MVQVPLGFLKKVQGALCPLCALAVVTKDKVWMLKLEPCKFEQFGSCTVVPEDLAKSSAGSVDLSILLGAGIVQQVTEDHRKCAERLGSLCFAVALLGRPEAKHNVAENDATCSAGDPSTKKREGQGSSERRLCGSGLSH